MTRIEEYSKVYDGGIRARGLTAEHLFETVNDGDGRTLSLMPLEAPFAAGIIPAGGTVEAWYVDPEADCEWCEQAKATTQYGGKRLCAECAVAMKEEEEYQAGLAVQD